MARLQKSLYVYNMNRHKKRTRHKTVIRLERNVVEAARQLVMEWDTREAERYRLMMMPLEPRHLSVNDIKIFQEERIPLAMLKPNIKFDPSILLKDVSVT